MVADWREDYNERRPHSALAMMAPTRFARAWAQAAEEGKVIPLTSPAKALRSPENGSVSAAQGENRTETAPGAADAAPAALLGRPTGSLRNTAAPLPFTPTTTTSSHSRWTDERGPATISRPGIGRCSPSRRSSRSSSARSPITDSVHVLVEALLGEPVRWATIKATLAGNPDGPTPRFVRVGRGRYGVPPTPSRHSINARDGVDHRSARGGSNQPVGAPVWRVRAPRLDVPALAASRSSGRPDGSRPRLLVAFQVLLCRPRTERFRFGRFVVRVHIHVPAAPRRANGIVVVAESNRLAFECARYSHGFWQKHWGVYLCVKPVR